MRRFLSSGFLFSLAILSTQAAFAGPWTPDPLHGYAKLGASYFQGGDRYLASGGLASERGNIDLSSQRLFDRTLDFYGEVGLIDGLAAIMKATAKRTTYRDASLVGTTTGLGDVGVGVRYRFLQKPLVLAVQAEGKFPTGYHDTYIPSLGGGQVDADLRLLVGQSFFPLPLYFSAEGGYRFRGGDFDDEIPYHFELGYTIAKVVMIQALCDGVHTRGTPVDIDVRVRPDIFSLAESYLRAGLQVIVFLPWNLQVSAQIGEVLTGEATWKGTRSEVGIAWKW